MAISLDPGAGGRSISSDALQISDIIVSTTNAAVSRVIRAGTLSAVSHAALYIGGDQVVEAIGAGVVMRPIDVALSDDMLAVVYRVPNLTDTQALKVRDFVGMNLGKAYSVALAAGAGISYGVRNSKLVNGYLCLNAGICTDADIPTPTTSDKFFCSQLVLAAFANAGMPLVNIPPSHVAPADVPDLWMRKALLYVGHLKP
ncbi:MAG TPA: hypothetical protein VG096_13260 [Bryobacteraceae bacterium]|nr:hypothetical protein [Bryobacteraceae bacterium]